MAPPRWGPSAREHWCGGEGHEGRCPRREGTSSIFAKDASGHASRVRGWSKETQDAELQRSKQRIMLLSNSVSLSLYFHMWEIKYCLRINQQSISQASVIAAASKGELVSPERTQEGKNIRKKPKKNQKKKTKKNPCHLAAIRRQPVPKVPWGKSGGENTGYRPWIAEVHVTGMIPVSQTLPCFHTKESTSFPNLRHLVFI